jgi:rare lipoprotein A
MKNNYIKVVTRFVLLTLVFSFSCLKAKPKSLKFESVFQDTLKKDSIRIDSILNEANYTYKLYKTKAHASYYAKKFDGKKTASGARFYNNKLTAAHRKLPFGTKLRITNERNGKSLIVIVNDRGPFVKGREIDLSRRAFMELAVNKSGGEMMVKIEVQKEK